MVRRVHRFFLGGGWVVRCRGVIKEKSPDFRSPEVGISANTTEQQPTETNLELSNAFAGKFKGGADKKLAKISEKLFE